MGNPGAQRDVDSKLQVVVTCACIEALENTLKPEQQPGDATEVGAAGKFDLSEEFMKATVHKHDFGQDKDGFYREIEGKKIYMDPKLVKQLKNERVRAGKTINIKNGAKLTAKGQEDIDRG